jgi:hypothetical protein
MKVPEIGEVYEDCAYHPVYCTESEGDDVAGVSLFDASAPRSCSVKHCGVRVLSAAEVAFKLSRREEWLAAEAAFKTRQERVDYDRLLAEEASIAASP